jgi:hypothetical protein
VEGIYVKTVAINGNLLFPNFRPVLAFGIVKVNVKLFPVLKLIKHRTMKACGGVDI